MTKQTKEQSYEKNKIAVLDCNNFFVSCERLFRPDLLKKPVLVLSGNDGCVVARSKEVKDMGIPMGVPYFQIKDIVKDKGITTFSSNFALYRDISRRVFEVVADEIGFIEQYSIDECFFMTNGDIDTILKLKDKIENGVGIPVSIGVASSKTQAKYVNLVAKKSDSGFEIWTSEEWSAQASKIKLSELWGVGREKSKLLNKYNLVTVEDFISLPRWQISNLFGIFGARLQTELLGEAVLPLKPQKLKQKSIMSSRSFSKTTSDKNQIKEAIKYHIYKCAENLNFMQLATRTLRISISPSRYGEFFMRNTSAEVVFPRPVDDVFSLTKEAILLLDRVFEKGVPYKKVGVTMSDLVDKNIITDTLFSSDNNQEAKVELGKLLFLINNKNGSQALKLGSLRTKLKPIWLSKKDSISPAYTTDWSELKNVH